MKSNKNKRFNDIRSKQATPISKIGNKNCLNFKITILLMMLSIFANAQRNISLSQAINSGLANKKNILAGKIDLTLSQLQTKSLLQKYLPQVSAEYQYMCNPILQTSILPIGVFNPSYPIDATKSVQFGTKWTQSAGLTAMQPVLDVSIQKQIKVAKLQERIATSSQQQSEYELAYTIAQTYIDIYLGEAKITSLIADTNRTYISYVLQKSKFDEKRLLKSDLNKSKINHNNSVQLLTDGIALLVEDKVYLLYLMGASEIEKWDFSIDSIFTINNSFVKSENKIDIELFPDLKQLNLKSELNSLQIKTERSKHIPTVGLKGYLGANQFSNTFKPTAANTWFGLSYVGLDIKVPILFGESTSNKIQQLRSQSEQYNLQMEAKEVEYTKDAITSKIKMENQKFQLKTQAENIELSMESIAIFQARFKEGQESGLNLNLEEANLQLLKADHEVHKKEMWTYWLDYLKASGQLTTLWN